MALAGLIAGLVAVSFYLERRYVWARAVGASLLIIAAAAVLSNLGLVAASSPIYDAITGPVTSLAIVWLLFSIDWKDVRAAGPGMLGAFAIAVVATATGALIAAAALGDAFPEDTWRLAGVMTGTYAGGGLNFVAVGRAVGLEDELFVAATAADNVVTALWVGATLMLPVWLGGVFRRRGARLPQPAPEGDGVRRDPLGAGARLDPLAVTALLALGFGAILVSEWLHALVPWIPAVLFLTTLALLLALVPWIRSLPGTFQLGLVALYFFFAVIGIGSRISEILRVGPEVFYFTAIVVAVHGFILYGAAWLLRLDVETVSVASQAAVGGPSTAMALSVARGWRQLELPGIAVGLLGYAVGNYAGLLIAAVVRDLF